MKKQIETTIDIDASPGQVWNVLTDTDAWPEWNPFIDLRAGSLELGSPIKIFVKPWGPSGAVLGATVIRNEPGRALAWRGGAPIPGIMTGEHYFRLEPLPGDRTRFIHGERWNGILVRFLANRIDRELGDKYAALNAALKTRVENLQPAAS